MADLLDYLDWRGDLTLAQDPFNEVDNLILAELSFVDFRDIVPPPEAGSSVELRTRTSPASRRGKKSTWGCWCRTPSRTCCARW